MVSIDKYLENARSIKRLEIQVYKWYEDKYVVGKAL